MASFIAVIRYALLETFFCISILPKTDMPVCLLWFYYHFALPVAAVLHSNSLIFKNLNGG